jgi:tRNA threonylcarbamoyladenosine biosynthesis protein TsaB
VIVLALDTTSRAGSVAVVQDGRVLTELAGDPQLTHGERLPGELINALDAARTPLGRVTLLAVAAGPGSFTGLRVGIASMQGLAMATGLRVVPVSAFEALARRAPAGDGFVGAWIDAQRGQVFAALFANGAGAATPLLAPSSLPPADTLALWHDRVDGRPITFIGDGAVRYGDVIREQLGAATVVVATAPPLAGAIGEIAAEHPERAVLPHAIVPIYVRRPDAELARMRTAGRSGD